MPGLAYGSLVPNRKEGFVFNEGRYVKAVSMAIDRQELIDKAFFGIGTVGYGTIAPSHFAYDAAFKPFEKPDPDGAKKLVSDVGKGPLSFEFLVPSGDPALLQQAQLIQAQLEGRHRRADLAARVRADPEAAGRPRVQGHDFVGWSGRIDPDGNTYDFNYTGGRTTTAATRIRTWTTARPAAAGLDEAQRKTALAQGGADLRRGRPGARLVPLRRRRRC